MNTKISTLVAVCIIALCKINLLNAQAPVGNAGDHTPVELGNSEAPFGYYEYLPTNFTANSDEKYPLIVFYHGYGERGNGASDLDDVLSFGPPSLINQGADFDAIIISPQNTTANYSASDFLSLFNYLTANYPIDTNRVYVTGLSSGGTSTWNALKGHFDKIAAALPICGFNSLNNPSEFLQQTPIWVHHSFNDDVVSRTQSINIVNRIANIGSSVMTVYPYGSGNSAANEDYSMRFDTNSRTWSLTEGTNEPTDKLSFTLYKDGGHNAWTRTYNNDDVWNWMLAQSLNSLSIEEEQIDFNLFPNPTSSKVTITSTDETEKRIVLYDAFGKKLYSNQFSTEHSINMNSYSSGIYFVKVSKNDEPQQVLKLIVN